jgi:multidrug efflux pump subunit AcrA (membrane-fusion protein)
MIRRKLFSTVIFSAALWCAACGANSNSTTKAAPAQPTATVEVVKVASKKLSITTRLPGELQAYEAVAVFPKVTAYVDSISVDRGTRVQSGQVMARVEAAGGGSAACGSGRKACIGSKHV